MRDQLCWALSLQISPMIVVDESVNTTFTLMLWMGFSWHPCLHCDRIADSFCKKKDGKNPSYSMANVSTSLYRQILLNLHNFYSCMSYDNNIFSSLRTGFSRQKLYPPHLQSFYFKALLLCWWQRSLWRRRKDSSMEKQMNQNA